MFWIIFIKTEPPEWMRHDPKIQDNLGRTMEMIWNTYVKTDPPEWMK